MSKRKFLQAFSWLVISAMSCATKTRAMWSTFMSPLVPASPSLIDWRSVTVRVRKIFFNPSDGSPEAEVSNVVAFVCNVMKQCIVVNQRVSKNSKVLVFFFHFIDPLHPVNFVAVVTSRPLCSTTKTHHRSIDDND